MPALGYQARRVPLFQIVQSEAGRNPKLRGGPFLKQQIGHIAELKPGIAVLSIQGQPAIPQTVPVLPVIGVPLPLKSQLIPLKEIAVLRRVYGICSAHRRLYMPQHRLAAAVLIRVLADHWPVVHPAHGLQMYDTSRVAHILKMQKPVLSVRRIHPCALVRAVHRGIALTQHDLFLIRAIDVTGAQHCLPAGLHTSRRSKDIVISVSFI